LAGNRGAQSWFLALIGGVLAAGPVYAWYALLRELRGNGMTASLAAVFLSSRSVKLPMLPLMIHYFGPAYTFVLCRYLLVFSIVSGVVMAKLADSEIA
jgi:hypothetical protein